MALELVTRAYNKVHGLLRRQEGQGMVEYGLILALVAIVVIAALAYIGTSARDKMQTVGDTLYNTP